MNMRVRLRRCLSRHSLSIVAHKHRVEQLLLLRKTLLSMNLRNSWTTESGIHQNQVESQSQVATKTTLHLCLNTIFLELILTSALFEK